MFLWAFVRASAWRWYGLSTCELYSQCPFNSHTIHGGSHELQMTPLAQPTYNQDRGKLLQSHTTFNSKLGRGND